MLVHAATAPRAAALVLPSLPVRLWRPTFDVAWGVTGAIGAAYRPGGPDGPVEPGHLPALADTQDACISTGDEHAIKFAEVAGESAGRGNAAGLRSAARAADLLRG
jgi:hypothetical protein